ncbi:MAG: diguanylate cyclase, partial [Comamonas sp.]|nr:diguanylate cyclase [Comamonas sp.]
ACTASIGVALFCGRDETLDSLMQRADQAMYQAKENGRNRVQLALTTKNNAGAITRDEAV